MKRFTISCIFGDLKWPFHIYVGKPTPDRHPLENQAHWLYTERGGIIPTEVMESFGKLHAIAKENNKSYEDLCVHALRIRKPKAPPKNKNNPVYLDSEALKTGNPQKFLGIEFDQKSEQSKTIKKPQNKNVALPADSLHRKTLPETFDFILEMTKFLWPGDNELSKASRPFFLSLALYITATTDKALTLSEIYRCITSDNPAYSFAVVLDTMGKTLPPLARKLITQWLLCDYWLRTRTLHHMTGTLMDFASGTPKEEKYEAIRKGFYESLIKELTP